MATLCLDARLWGIRHTGIGRYTQELIANLQLPSPIHVVLIVSPDMLAVPELANFFKIAAKYHPYSVLSQLGMARILWQLRPDLLYIPHFTIPLLWPGRMVITIHDLIKHYSRGPATTTRAPALYWLKYLAYRFIVFVALHRAQKIIIPSQYWRRQLEEHFRIPASRLEVVYEGVSAAFSETTSAAVNIPPSPFVVYTGNLYPHKNIPTLLAAINRLKGRVHLALVGSRNVFRDRLPQSPYVHYLGRLTDNQLVTLYRRATAFVFPSLIEGFGLPGLEAMAVGLPVIAARATSLPEIYGSAALYFSPLDDRQLSERILSLLSSSPLRRKLITRGKIQAGRYSWQAMSQHLCRLFLAELL